jgi:hypothetical protein
VEKAGFAGGQLFYFIRRFQWLQETSTSGKEKWKIPEREGRQALAEVGSTHFKRIRQSVFSLIDLLTICKHSNC